MLDLNNTYETLTTTTNGIEPKLFISRMKDHWTDLGNVTSRALEDTWGQICEIFNTHIQRHGTDSANEWTVLSPPTGTGKTESAVIYCSMLADLPNDIHPGVVMVTRLIDDCDRIAGRINQFGNRSTAIAYHSKGTAKLTDLRKWPTVVITHKAYELALDYLGHEGRIERTWPFFHDWGEDSDNNRRALVIVDECLDIVDHNKVTLEGLRHTLGSIPERVRERHPQEIEAVNGMVSLLEDTGRRAKLHKEETGRFPGEAMLISEPPSRGIAPDLRSLIESLKDIQFDHLIGKNDPLERERLRRKHAERLQDLDYMFKSWLYYSHNNRNIDDPTFNTARLLIPEDVKGAVVMDATASTNLVYELHKDSRMITPPEGSRTYRTFKLHVSRGHRVGKNHMVENAKTLCPDMVAELNGKFDKSDKVFLCCHKGVEPTLQKYNTTFEMMTGHWGAVAGSNSWRDCNKVVIFGLPYLPPSWSANTFMALQDPMDTAWMQSDGDRQWGPYKDVRYHLQRGQISADVVQAINRIRSRKVINQAGECPDAEGYILLPAGELGDDILKDIQTMMPDIQVVDWEYKNQRRKARASKHEGALVTYIENMTYGRYLPSAIRREIGMSPRTWKRLVKSMKDPESRLGQVLKEHSVRYTVEGTGRLRRASLVKET